MRKLLIFGAICGLGLLCVAGALFALVIWPTPYRYQESAIGKERVSVRISRSSGKTERLTKSGWAPMETTVASSNSVTCEEARSLYLEHGQYASIIGTPPPGCDLTEARRQYECRRYRENAISTPYLLRSVDPPLGCNVDDLLMAYDRTRTTR
jgi:hypothetical protein